MFCDFEVNEAIDIFWKAWRNDNENILRSTLNFSTRILLENSNRREDTI